MSAESPRQTPHVMVSLIGLNPMEEVPAPIGEDRRVVAIGHTLLAGVTPAMAAQWIHVLTPIAESAAQAEDGEREDERMHIVVSLQEQLESVKGGDAYSQGRISGLLRAIKLVNDRRTHRA